jgi:hypothetical protein
MASSLLGRAAGSAAAHSRRHHGDGQQRHAPGPRPLHPAPHRRSSSHRPVSAQPDDDAAAAAPANVDEQQQGWRPSGEGGKRPSKFRSSWRARSKGGLQSAGDYLYELGKSDVSLVCLGW